MQNTCYNELVPNLENDNNNSEKNESDGIGLGEFEAVESFAMERDQKFTDNSTLNDKKESSWIDSNATITAVDVSKDITKFVENTEVYSTEGAVLKTILKQYF